MDGPYSGAVGLVDANKDPISKGNALPVSSQSPAGVNLLSALFEVTVIGTTVLLAGAANQTIKIWRAIIQITGTQTAKLQSVGVDISPTYINNTFVLPLNYEPWFASSLGGNIAIVTTTTTRVSIQFWYTQD